MTESGTNTGSARNVCRTICKDCGGCKCYQLKRYVKGTCPRESLACLCKVFADFEVFDACMTKTDAPLKL